MSEQTRSRPNLGDPNDKSLRKVEIEVLIPKKMREIANKEKCHSEVLSFINCSRESGLGVMFKCRQENSKLWECLTGWYNNEDFKSKCTQEYLDERSEYRRTGIKKTPRNQRAELKKKETLEKWKTETQQTPS